MKLPMVALAALAVVGGYTGIYPRAFAGIVELIPEADGATHAIILGTSLVVLAIGVGLALYLYRPSTAAGSTGGAEFKDPFDTGYTYYIEKIQQRFAMVLNFIDLLGIAGLVRSAAEMVGLAGFGARALHSGRINGYVYWFLAGLAILWAFAIGVF